MRVLLLSPSAVPGGAERAFASLARQMPHLGIECKAVLLQPGPLEQWLASANCQTEVIDARRTRHIHRTAHTLTKLAKLATQADVVLSNQTKGHVYGGLASLLARRPAVWWQQGIPEPSTLEHAAARVPSNLIIASSEAAVQAQRRMTPKRRVELVHLGIDTGSVRRRKGSGTEVRLSHNSEGRKLVGIVGRLQEWKGQDVFLRAAARIAADHPDVDFLLVGGAVLGWEGDYPERLRRLASELGIDDRVHFVGHQDDVYPWFDALDVVVHASHGEPFGLVLVEAMALGRPLVATAAGGPVEIIEDGISGFLVPPGDHDAMAESIAKLLDDDELRHRVGEAAEVRAEMFDEERMATSIVDLLSDVVGTERSDSAAAGCGSMVADIPGSEPARALVERSVPGLHQHVFDHVVCDLPAGTALDLGAGSGAFAERLAHRGHDVLAADLDASGFQATVPFETVDLNTPEWAGRLGLEKWSLITAIEVIEHLENPIGFLRDLGRLLAPDGTAIITTPNVDSLPARLKFLLRGRIRMLDEWGDPTHISPIFWDLLNRKYLPLAGLRMLKATTYPTDGFLVGRPVYSRALRAMRPLISRSDHLVGDNHILVLARPAATPCPGAGNTVR